MQPQEVAHEFNARINARSLDGLAELMTRDHVFVDSAGSRVEGRAECTEAWRGFFESFPSYRNEFESMKVEGTVVTISGRSFCDELPELDGPAVWTATVVGERISVWRVHDAS